ncbi:MULTISPECIES: hypothetical protein [unclassified Schlesneria]|uniref:hypothetical protein n=1 Tax=Schlesneria TaxID=656899 RepID=UPI002EF77476
MFSKIAHVIAGLMLTVSSVGCCCLGGYGYGAGYGMNRCAPCNNGCSPSGGYLPQTGSLYQSDFSQAAFAPGYTQAAFVPTQTATVIPGAVQGAAIYNSAALVPVNGLPTY